MRIRIFVAFVVASTLGVAHAHHSRAAFESEKEITLQMTVKEVRWNNPHVYFVGDVMNAKNQAEEWLIEGHSISILTRFGWTKTTLQPGDRVQMTVWAHRDPERHSALLDQAITAQGVTYYSVRHPNQKPTVPVKASTDFSGNWGYQYPGTPEEVRKRVLLGASSAPVGWPYTEKGLAQAKAYSVKNSPALKCLPYSLPALLQIVYEYKWIRYEDRIEIKKEQLTNSDRIIHLTKNKAFPPGYKPNALGYSIGWFEPDGTLVVETTGFNAVKWGNGPGIDSSEKKHIVERYNLVNGGMGISLSYTQEDPDYIKQPVMGHAEYIKMPDSNFAEQPPCDPETAAVYE